MSTRLYSLGYARSTSGTRDSSAGPSADRNFGISFPTLVTPDLRPAAETDDNDTSERVAANSIALTKEGVEALELFIFILSLLSFD